MEPGSRGFSRSNLLKLWQFEETYRTIKMSHRWCDKSLSHTTLRFSANANCLKNASPTCASGPPFSRQDPLFWAGYTNRRSRSSRKKRRHESGKATTTLKVPSQASADAEVVLIAEACAANLCVHELEVDGTNAEFAVEVKVYAAAGLEGELVGAFLTVGK
jgi:hypothetical protein